MLNKWISNIKKTNLCWSHAPGVRNWGDDINPLLFEWITGKKPKALRIGEHKNTPHYMMIGSIIRHANRYSTVWGSGIMSMIDAPNPSSTYKMVRGKYTRKQIIECGGKCPPVYGDPAMLFPLFYNKKMDRQYDLGIIPHFVDKKIVKLSTDNINITLIDICGDMIEFVNQVRRCKMIASSSLHGLIIADAYSIPSRWVKFSGRLHGDDIKFIDHFSTIGRLDRSYVNLRGGLIKDDTIDYLLKSTHQIDIDLDLDSMMNSCPFR